MPSPKSADAEISGTYESSVLGFGGTFGWAGKRLSDQFCKRLTSLGGSERRRWPGHGRDGPANAGAAHERHICFRTGLILTGGEARLRRIERSAGDAAQAPAGNSTRRTWKVAACGLVLVCCLASRTVISTEVNAAQEDGFTVEQAARGKLLFLDTCAMCHGPDLNGQSGPPLKGEAFYERWRSRSTAELFDFMSSAMPPTQPGRLRPDGYADVLAFILQENGVSAGSTELPSDSSKLHGKAFPK
jgi:mono/diheme cytochrome c family protein